MSKETVNELNLKEVESKMKDEKTTNELQQEVKIETEEEKIKKEIEEKINKANIPLRLRGASLETFIATTKEQKKIKEIAVKFIDEYPTTHSAGLIFTGEPITGKSHLACAILQEMIKRYNITGEIVNETDVFFYGKNKVSLDLLVIEIKDFVFKEDVEKLILKRYNNMKPTILVTNTLPSFLERGKATRKKFELAGGKIVTFTTNSK